MIRTCIPALAFLTSLFSTLATLLWLAGDRCLDAGGRTSDTAWTCEFPGSDPVSLWSLMGTIEVLAVALLIGLPCLLLIRRLGRRWDTCAIPPKSAD